MRPTPIAVVVGFLLTGVMAFFGGEQWAKYDARRDCQAAMSLTLGWPHAEALSVVGQALHELRGGRTKEADTLLLRYAKLRVPQITECAKSTPCVFWAGELMPSAAQLSEIASMKELP
jgi:hypothetical protein